MFTTHVLEKETWDKLEENVSDILEDAKLLAPNEAGLIKESSSYVTSSQGIYGGIEFIKTKKVYLTSKNCSWSQKKRSCSYAEYQRLAIRTHYANALVIPKD